MNEFKRVNIQEYVKEGLESGKLVPIQAKKTAPTHLVPGTLGEEVTSWVENEDGTPRIEREEKVEKDPETGQPGWIATKVDSKGNPVVDGNGHKNQWIIQDSFFRANYEPSKVGDNLYQKKAVQTLVQIPDNIEFENKKGKVMTVEAGGYINITDLSNMHGISERDFNDTHELAHTVSLDEYQVLLITKKDRTVLAGCKHWKDILEESKANEQVNQTITKFIWLPSQSSRTSVVRPVRQAVYDDFTISTVDGVNYTIVGNEISSVEVSDSYRKQFEEIYDSPAGKRKLAEEQGLTYVGDGYAYEHTLGVGDEYYEIDYHGFDIAGHGDGLGYSYILSDGGQSWAYGTHSQQIKEYNAAKQRYNSLSPVTRLFNLITGKTPNWDEIKKLGFEELSELDFGRRKK